MSQHKPPVRWRAAGRSAPDDDDEVVVKVHRQARLLAVFIAMAYLLVDRFAQVG